MKTIDVIKKTLALLLAFAVVAINFGSFMTGLRGLPEAYYAENEAELYERLGNGLPFSGLTVAAGNTGDETLGKRVVEYSLFGKLILKRVTAYVSERPKLTPGGQAVGISIYTDGVLVVGLGSFRDENGLVSYPARDAGLKAGDVILSVNGNNISTSEELQEALSAGGGQVIFEIERSGKRSEVTVFPSVSESGEPRIGAWVRDSTVGVGTLSFFDPETGDAAALGHAVVDADTGARLKVKDGQLVLAEIIGITPGRQGIPGELHGTFDEYSEVLGDLSINTELGVFGSLKETARRLLGGETLETAFPDEVRTGDAYLITSVDGIPTAYNCRIVKAGKQNEPAPKGLIIEITDDTLIEFAGGVVQGMSGSPVIQDGKLVGVITHVFINEPKLGYGAYAYWMYEMMNGGK